MEEGTYSHGRKTGIWIKYHKDGKTVKLKGDYINNRPQGNYARFYSNGKEKEKGNFGNDQYLGSLVRYHINGVVAYSATFGEDGKEDGAVKHYYPNGILQAEYQLKNGKVDGKVVQYNVNGSVKTAANVTNGKLTTTVKAEKKAEIYTEPTKDEPPPNVLNPITKGVTFFSEGYNKVYNDNDEIWLDGNFKNGQLWDGKVYVYSVHGILSKVKIYKEGKFHSLGQY